MKYSNFLFISSLVCALFLSGCIGQTGGPSIEDTAINECKVLCSSALKSGQDLSNGPCLSNSVAEGWICDVAHNPRAAVDNDPANQCSAYREGKAAHFVEVDTSCSLIRAV